MRAGGSRLGPRIWALAALLGLAACGSGQNAALSVLGQGVGSIASRGAPAVDLRATLTPASVAAANQPLIYVALPDRGAQAVATLAGDNRGIATWATQDGVTLSVRRGIVVATRGLGGDLLSADIADVEARLYGGGGRATRIHRFLDGEDQTRIAAFICDLSVIGPEIAETALGGFATTRIDENCAGPEVTFLNRYWIGPNGVLRKTRQWLGPVVGWMVIERLTGE